MPLYSMTEQKEKMEDRLDKLAQEYEEFPAHQRAAPKSVLVNGRIVAFDHGLAIW